MPFTAGNLPPPQTYKTPTELLTLLPRDNIWKIQFVLFRCQALQRMTPSVHGRMRTCCIIATVQQLFSSVQHLYCWCNRCHSIRWRGFSIRPLAQRGALKTAQRLHQQWRKQSESSAMIILLSRKIIPLLPPQHSLQRVTAGFHMWLPTYGLNLRVVLLIVFFTLSPFARSGCRGESRMLGERRNEVYLKVIYFCCHFVGWRGSDKCELVVYEAWLSAGRAAFLWGSWLSV